MLTSPLQGYRTYILATLGIIVGVLGFFSVLTPVEVQGIETVLGFGGLLTLRAAVKAIEPQG